MSTTTDQTPDAVRAAIDRARATAREICAGNKEVWEGAELAIALVERELDRLAQIGAVPAAGEDTVPIPRKWAVALTTTLHNVSGFHALPEQDRCALRNLSAIVAAALAQIGALRPVGEDVLPIGTRVHVYDRMGHGIDGEIVGIEYVIKTDSGIKLTYTRKWIEPLANGADDGGALRPVGVTIDKETLTVLQLAVMDTLGDAERSLEYLTYEPDRMSKALWVEKLQSALAVIDAAARAGDNG